MIYKTVYVISKQATISRFNKLKLTTSNPQILKKLDELGQHHDVHLFKAKERISSENVMLQRIEEKHSAILTKHASHVSCTSSCIQERNYVVKEEHELNKSSHPGFVISFDNLDFQLQRKSITMDSQNRDFHWINHQMIENRVSGNILNSKEATADLLKVSVLKFLPTIEDQQRQRHNYTVLASRILVDHFEVLQPLNPLPPKGPIRFKGPSS